MTPLTGKFYLVVSDFYRQETPFKRRYVGFEAILNEHCLHREELIRDLADGQYEYGGNAIRQIIEVDMASGSARDVTQIIGGEVKALLVSRGDEETPDWIEEARYRGPKVAA